MKIELQHQKKRLHIKEKKALLISLAIICILILPSLYAVKNGLIHSGYVALHQDGKNKAKQLLSDLASAPKRLVSANTDIPLLKIDIKYQDWLKLSEDRENALKNGAIAEKRHQVSALIYHQQQKYNASVRLQGDLIDHIAGAQRWSLRFEIKKKKALFSTRRFALLSSSVRTHQGPSLFSKSMEVAEFDIISQKYKPVKVVVNGVDWGVMLFEEAFGQDLLATNNRTEGLIVRFDMADQSKDQQGNIKRTLSARVLQNKKVMENDSLRAQRSIALSLLNEFIDGQRSASEVFDHRRLGQYLATVDLWSAWHALTWNNWRWYYNPHTAKLEPIQSDVAISPALHYWQIKSPTQSFLISRRMLADKAVYASYQAAIEKLQVVSANGQIQHNLDVLQSELTSQLHASSPLISNFEFNRLNHKLSCISSSFESHKCQVYQAFDESLHLGMDEVVAQPQWDLITELQTTKEGNLLTIINNQNKALKVRKISGLDEFAQKMALDELNADFPLVVEPDKRLSLLLPKSAVQARLVAGLDVKKMREYNFVKDIKPLHFIPRPKPDLDISHYPFIEQGKGYWRFKAGKWDINDMLVSPANWRVEFEAGSQLQFSSSAGLMIFGHVIVNGNSISPVVFDKQAMAQSWYGLTVFSNHTSPRSQISQLQISHARNPVLGLWRPRGSAYFVGTTLDVNGLKITKNYSEDALNIINGDVKIKNLEINEALSDAFDCDFCSGSVDGAWFNNIGARSGGDGIDVSGSMLNIRNAHFNNIRDKAISGGERSLLVLNDCYVSNANFAIVSKDDSKIMGDLITVNNIKHYGLMTYSKKAIFGSAKMAIDRYTCGLAQCDSSFMSELGSELFVNSNLVPTQKISIKNLYNTIMKSDKPK